MAALFLLSLLLLSCSASQPSEEEFNIQTKLLSSLYGTSYAMFSIKELFYPRVGTQPICARIKYELSCNDTDFTYNSSYLWTTYNSQSNVGRILLSSAYYGIVLKGFDWESNCYTDAKSETVLQLELASCLNITDDSDSLNDQLRALTATLKAYAESSDKPPKGDDLIANKAYAVSWKECSQDNEIFYDSYVILSTLVAVLDFFIFMFSLGICSSVYDVIYSKIKGKKNPYYPLFMSSVICSIAWNILPGWLVLSFDTDHVRYSFAALIPIQLLLAILMKKYTDFPIPGIPCVNIKYTILREIPPTRKKKKGSKDKDTKYFFWEICHLKNKATVIISFVVQTLAIWSLLVFFTYIVYYGVAVTISLYLNPIQTLVKVIFVKAIAVCVLFDIAILFSGSAFDFTCSRKGFVKDINDFAMLFALLSFLLVIAFLAYVTGGIIFNSSANQLSGIQGVLAILPSAILVLIGWYSKGTLFPEKLIADETSDEQILSDVESAAEEHHQPTGKKSSTNKHETDYGATDS